MLFVLTLLAFCAATAYISAPFWSRRSTPMAVLSPVAEVNGERRRRVEAEAEIEILVARTRRRLQLQNTNVQTKALVEAWHCTQCSRQMGQDDRFCASCGAARPEL